MKTKLETMLGNVASDIYDTVSFKNVIEDNLQWLINHPTTVNKQVTAHLIDVYAFDWLGLLSELSIPADLHHTVIRMNGGFSFTDLPNSLRTIAIPNPALLQNFVMLLSSTGKVQ